MQNQCFVMEMSNRGQGVAFSCHALPAVQLSAQSVVWDPMFEANKRPKWGRTRL